MTMEKTTPPVGDENKKVQPKQRRLPTPQQFYQKLVEREDIRAILSRLAKN